MAPSEKATPDALFLQGEGVKEILGRTELVQLLGPNCHLISWLKSDRVSVDTVRGRSRTVLLDKP